MEYKQELYKKEWKVVSLMSGAVPEGTIPIDEDKFQKVKNYCTALGYRDVSKSDKEIRYEHYSISGLYLCVNAKDKIVRVESTSETALYQVVEDFGLPMY